VPNFIAVFAAGCPAASLTLVFHLLSNAEANWHFVAKKSPLPEARFSLWLNSAFFLGILAVLFETQSHF
jgi:hypothetical protein